MLECDSISSSILSQPVAYCVDLPAGYATSGTHYPVLYFLHGLFENERSWADRGGKEILESLLAQGDVGKFIVVCPDGGKSFYVNSYDGHDRYEDFFIQEFVPFIDKKYRTLGTRDSRQMSGSSMGGYGALHFAMRHPEVFSAVSAQSAALLPKFPNPIPAEHRWELYSRLLQAPFGSPINEAYFDANNPLTMAEHPQSFADLKMYFDVGDHDRYGFEEGNELLDHILTEQHFSHQFAIRSGDHGWSYLSQYMKYALEFHWHLFESAKGSASAAAGKGSKS